MIDVAALAKRFAAEREPGAEALIPTEPHQARRILADLLTIREPAPIPADVAAPLDELLAAESSALPRIDASALPSLADAGLAGGPTAGRMALWHGDLTRLEADAIVNAANDRMLGCFVPGHACIDNAIHAVAGPGLRAECDRHVRTQGHREPTGTATVTGGHHLPARHVIHTVGPIVPNHRPSTADRDALVACYTSILDAAERQGFESVGFCAISTGVFGYPKDEGARVAVSTIAEWLTAHPLTAVRPILAAFTPADEAVYRAAISEVLV